MLCCTCCMECICWPSAVLRGDWRCSHVASTASLLWTRRQTASYRGMDGRCWCSHSQSKCPSGSALRSISTASFPANPIFCGWLHKLFPKASLEASTRDTVHIHRPLWPFRKLCLPKIPSVHLKNTHNPFQSQGNSFQCKSLPFSQKRAEWGKGVSCFWLILGVKAFSFRPFLGKVCLIWSSPPKGKPTGKFAPFRRPPVLPVRSR